MKKILFTLLLFTGFLQAQTYPVNPTKFGKISLNTNGVSTSTNKINTQEADGQINYIDAINLPISAATQVAIDGKVSDTIRDGINAIAPSENAVYDALQLKENISNKATDFTTVNNTLYPSVQAVESRVLENTLLENKEALRDFYKNLYNFSLAPTNSFIGISTWGDSVSPEVFAPFVLSLKSRYQIGCILFPAADGGFDSANFISSSGTIFNSDEAVVNQSVYDGTGGFADFTYMPSGKHREMSNGSVLTYGSGQNTGNVLNKNYFVTGPGMGSVLVELLNESGSTVLNSNTINLSGVSLGATKVEFSLVNTTKYRVRITATGKVVFLLGGFFKSNGMLPFSLGRGSTTLLQNNYSNKTILNYLISEFKTSLMFMQVKEDNLNTLLPPTITTLNSLTTTSKLFVGSAPDSSDASIQVSNNSIIRKYALENDYSYFNAYKVMKDWNEVVRLGFNADGTHLGPSGTRYLGMTLNSFMGYFNQINAVEKKDINNISTGGNVSTNILKIAKGNVSGENVDVITNAGGGIPNEVYLKNVRNLYLGEFSLDYPTINLYTSQYVGIFNRALNQLRGLRVGNVTAESLTLMNTPPSPAGTYDLLVRNKDATVNAGRFEVIPSSTYSTPADLSLKANLASPTFTGTPEAPTPTTTNGITTKGYVDGLISTTDTNALHKTGNETFTGVKTATNTGSSVTNGLTLINSGPIGSRVINGSSTSSGDFMRVDISSSGRAIFVNNSSSNSAISVANISGTSGVAFSANAESTATGYLYEGRNNSTLTYYVKKTGEVTAAPATVDTELATLGQVDKNKLISYTFATLPASPSQGDSYSITDALAPAYLAPAVGGGSVYAPVVWNGTTWVCH